MLARVAKAAADQQQAAAAVPSPAVDKAPAACKEHGNALFKTGKHREALQEYSAGLRALSSGALVLSNRAACATELSTKGGQEAVVMDCCAALVMDGTHVKSRHRCAQALLGLSWLAEAQVTESTHRDAFN